MFFKYRSIIPHQCEVCVVFITELGVCLGLRSLTTEADVKNLPKCYTDANEFVLVCFWSELWISLLDTNVIFGKFLRVSFFELYCSKYR